MMLLKFQVFWDGTNLLLGELPGTQHHFRGTLCNLKGGVTCDDILN
jgi:hypothetical protein